MEEIIKILGSTTRILFPETDTKNQILSRETHLQKVELNTNNLLAGVGAVIFMLLFIIGIEMRRKTKPPKRFLPKRNENQTCDETFKRPQSGSSKVYLNITSSKLSNDFYQHMDPVYHEIDEYMELMQIPASIEIPTVLGHRSLPTFNNNSTRNVPKNDDLNAQTSESYVLPSTESTTQS